MGALLVGYGLCEDRSKIAIIDSECHSADLYAHLGSYHALPLSAPFTPELSNSDSYKLQSAG